MAKRQHIKSKDKNVQQKLDLIARSSERKTMPRPTVFKNKKAYDRKKSRKEIRLCLA